MALVEGHTEESFFRHIFHRKFKAVRCIPNGCDVSLERIFSEICLNIEVLPKGFRSVFIVLDREKREMTSAEIEGRLRILLEERYEGLNFFIGVCDRMIENWILSGTTSYDFDASRQSELSGKEKMKRLFGRDLSPNQKAIELKKIDKTLAAARSKDFKSFIDQVNCCCFWFPSNCERCC